MPHANNAFLRSCCQLARTCRSWTEGRKKALSLHSCHARHSMNLVTTSNPLSKRMTRPIPSPMPLTELRSMFKPPDDDKFSTRLEALRTSLATKQSNKNYGLEGHNLNNETHRGECKRCRWIHNKYNKRLKQREEELGIDEWHVQRKEGDLDGQDTVWEQQILDEYGYGPGDEHPPSTDTSDLSSSIEPYLPEVLLPGRVLPDIRFWRKPQNGHPGRTHGLIYPVSAIETFGPFHLRKVTLF